MFPIFTLQSGNLLFQKNFQGIHRPIAKCLLSPYGRYFPWRKVRKPVFYRNKDKAPVLSRYLLLYLLVFRFQYVSVMGIAQLDDPAAGLVFPNRILSISYLPYTIHFSPRQALHSSAVREGKGLNGSGLSGNTPSVFSIHSKSYQRSNLYPQCLKCAVSVKPRCL